MGRAECQLDLPSELRPDSRSSGRGGSGIDASSGSASIVEVTCVPRARSAVACTGG